MKQRFPRWPRVSQLRLSCQPSALVKGGLRGHRPHERGAVLPALALANAHGALTEEHVLATQPDGFAEPQAAVREQEHEGAVPSRFERGRAAGSDQGAHLVRCRDPRDSAVG
jgi:hypothetical protein